MPDNIARNINIIDCDFCKREGKEGYAEYDGRTKYGPWAGMCEKHFREHGVGLGTGKGQRLYPNGKELKSRKI